MNFLFQDVDQIKDGSALGVFVDLLVFAKEDSDAGDDVAVEIVRKSGQLVIYFVTSTSSETLEVITNIKVLG